MPLMLTPDQVEAVRQAADTAKEYAGIIIKPPAAELAALLTDTVKGWRFANQVRVVSKMKALCEARGINPRDALPEVFVPLLESAANVSDDTLADMFARLLASHVDPTTNGMVHPAFAKIIPEMSPLDALMLVLIAQRHAMKHPPPHPDPTKRRKPKPIGMVTVADLHKAAAKSVQWLTTGTSSVSLHNLRRLQLVDDDSEQPQLVSLDPHFVKEPEGWHLTVLGSAFVAACVDPALVVNESPEK